MDPKIARDPLDLETALVFFARETKNFQVPTLTAPKDKSQADAGGENTAAVFIVGLDAGHPYHVEIDGQEMVEETADPGGIVFLPTVPSGGVRLAARTVVA